MPYRNILDNWIGFVSGVFGFGTSYTLQITLHDEGLKLVIAGMTATVAGGMGVVGKYLAVWGWKKVKNFFIKKQNKV